MQYYVYTVKTVMPNVLKEISDVALYFKTMGVRNEEFMIENVLHIYNVGSATQTDL